MIIPQFTLPKLQHSYTIHITKPTFLQIDIEEQEVSRKEKELFCSKRAPAEAEAKRLTILAEAERVKTLCYASAESTAIKVGLQLNWVLN